MTDTVEYSWLDLVIRANPEHTRESRFVIEYEFTSMGGGIGYVNGDKTHEDGKRVFRGLYDERGPYQPEAASTSGLTWGGLSILWDGEELTWGGV